jgi:hypothetical protein
MPASRSRRLFHIRQLENAKNAMIAIAASAINAAVKRAPNDFLFLILGILTATVLKFQICFGFRIFSTGLTKTRK